MSDSEISGSESELSDDENNDAFMLFRDEQEVGRQRILAMLQDDEDEINFDGFLPNFDKDPAFHFCNKQSEDISSSVYSGRPGPMRIFDGSCSALEYFQLFFTDELFEKISYWTHENACYKIANEQQSRMDSAIFGRNKKLLWNSTGYAYVCGLSKNREILL